MRYLVFKQLIRYSVMIGLLSCSYAVLAEEAANYFLIHYSPADHRNGGPVRNNDSLLKAHHDYILNLNKIDRVVLAGPTTDQPGSLVLVRRGSLADAKMIVTNDPAVIAGVLVGDVSGWSVETSSMRFVHRQPLSSPKNYGESYKVKRTDPESPINH